MIEWALQVGGFGSDGWDTDSRFGHGPSPYTSDYDVSFWRVLFIMFVVIAGCWYILTVLNKQEKQRPSNIPDETP